MTNPYQAPVIDAGEQVSLVREKIEPTWVARIVGSACFFVGCAVGMISACLIDQGIDEVARLIVNAPFDGLFVFAVVSQSCLTVVAIWKFLRGLLVDRYFAPPGARFVAGILGMMLFYFGVIFFERQFTAGSDLHFVATTAWAVISVAVVVEFESIWTWFQQTKRATIDDVS